MCERSSLPTCSTCVSACSARMRRKLSCPARFSAIHSRAKSPSWISLRIWRVAGRVLLDGDQPGDSAAFGELAADQMAGALRRDHADVDAGRRGDLFVVDGEAVAEQDHVALGDPVADLLLPDVVMTLVGEQD